MDMLVNLQCLPPIPAPEGIRLVRPLPPDYAALLAFVQERFGEGWRCECRQALSRQPSGCFVAIRDSRLVGFACYDATAKGFFGPIGVDEAARGHGIGKALLLSCLHAMVWDGYGYAVIGWCDGAADFYRSIGAVEIPNSAPAQSVYGRMIHQPQDEHKEEIACSPCT